MKTLKDINLYKFIIRMRIKLEILNDDQTVKGTRTYKSIKDCADEFKMSYHKIQRLMYMNTDKLKPKKAILPETENLLKKYRITPIIDEINLN
jgi:hypothetical protein